MSVRTTIITGLLILLCGMVAYIGSSFVPYNMDEFSLYHTLSCIYYEHNSLNSFRVGCHEYDLTLQGTQNPLPLREYTYMGSVTSLYYAPFFLLSHSPISARFVGLLFLIPQAYIFALLLKRKGCFPYIFFGLTLFFPYFFQHFADTGVVGFQITLALMIIYFLQKWVHSQKGVYIIGGAILFFIGLWAKLTFLWFVPAFTICLIGYTYYHYKKKSVLHVRTYSVQIILAFIVFIILSTILFSAKDIYGNPYVTQLTHTHNGKTYSLIETIKKIHPHNIANSPITKALINPLESTQRIYVPESPTALSYIYAFILLIGVPFGIIYLSWRKNYTKKLLVTTYIVAFYSTLVYIFYSQRMVISSYNSRISFFNTCNTTHL